MGRGVTLTTMNYIANRKDGTLVHTFLYVLICI